MKFKCYICPNGVLPLAADLENPDRGHEIEADYHVAAAMKFVNLVGDDDREITVLVHRCDLRNPFTWVVHATRKWAPMNVHEVLPSGDGQLTPVTIS